ncbi:putative efflux protein, MATE family [Robiginitalea myxolifaciens]|uniref:Multidrug-efflux transporter n=1 Tax=Robiginitalea myxolifaciens TaxID=400055 RepID=A0A1I6G4R7_9FLAO|nr:MATE family efflux transporter [Robiginitalea myxolifaciens]SFR37198.1 putative efflux protein, MATE family [Robiginitalea myxolifaciens]
MDPVLSRRNINRLAIPAVFAGIAEPVLSITDTAIVGNIPEQGLESLAAAGIVGSFLSMLIWILGQTRSAISALISQYLGANKLDAIKTLPAQAIALNIGISILILLGTLPLSTEIFKLLNASGTILDLSVNYYNIRVWGFPLTLFTFAIMGIFQGLQNTYYPMIIALTGTILNILLDLLLVYGWEGFIPAMYLEGAAWASLIAQGVMALMALVLLWRNSSISILPKGPLHPELKRLIGMALNLFVRTLSLNIALLLAVREATALGDEIIGAHTIAINLWLFSAFFIDGYSAAGKILGGRFLGAGDYNRLWTLARKVLVYGWLVAAGLMLTGAIAYYPMGRIFSSDPRVLQAFYSIFFVVILTMPINTLAFVYDGIFKGLGEMRFLRNVLLSATFLAFIPALYLGKWLEWGLYGIWFALTLWMLVRGLALVVKFRRKFRPLLQKT